MLSEYTTSSVLDPTILGEILRDRIEVSIMSNIHVYCIIFSLLLQND